MIILNLKLFLLIKQIEQYCIENNVFETIKYVLKWGRLFGGGGLVVNNGQNPRNPLKISDINKDTPLAFYHADCWELSGFSSKNNKGVAEVNNIDWGSDTPFTYYGYSMNKDRVFLYKGKEAPSLLRYRLRGWGMSEIERFVRSINQFIKNNNVIYELLDEAKIDIYSVSGFNDSLQDIDGTQAIADGRLFSTYASSVTSSSLPDSLRYIGNENFYWCNITEVVLP